MISLETFEGLNAVVCHLAYILFSSVRNIRNCCACFSATRTVVNSTRDVVTLFNAGSQTAFSTLMYCIFPHICVCFCAESCCVQPLAVNTLSDTESVSSWRATCVTRAPRATLRSRCCCATDATTATTPSASTRRSPKSPKVSACQLMGNGAGRAENADPL